jgi:hypothetical protein
VKGNKKDLLSALMETLAGEENGKEENSPVGKVNPSEAPSNQKVGASIVVEEKKKQKVQKLFLKLLGRREVEQHRSQSRAPMSRRILLRMSS